MALVEVRGLQREAIRPVIAEGPERAHIILVRRIDRCTGRIKKEIDPEVVERLHVPELILLGHLFETLEAVCDQHPRLP